MNAKIMHSSIVRCRSCSKTFIYFSYCAFWMQARYSIAHFKATSFCPKVDCCLVNLPVCNTMVCFSSILLEKKNNQKGRYCCCTYACCSPNQSSPFYLLHTRQICLPPAHSQLYTHACPTASRCALKCTQHSQIKAGNWGVDLCCSSVFHLRKKQRMKSLHTRNNV